MSLTPDQLAAARQWAADTREAQGLPPKIQDPATLAKVAVLLKPAGHRAVPTSA